MELMWLASVLIGGAVLMVAWWFFSALLADDPDADAEWRYDRVRIAELKRHDFLYRALAPLFAGLGRLNRIVFRDSLPEVQRELQAAGQPRYWLPEEYLARCELLAILLSPAMIASCIGIMGPLGIVTGLVLVALTAWLLRRRLAAQARQRLTLIKRRLPFFLDLLTLLMEAGSSLLQALEEAVHEFRGQPVAEEFGRVLADIRMGRTRTESFLAMRERLQDAEVGGVIGSIVQGEHLGTPLAQIFRMQADVLRVKRTQRAETIAAEAGVQMLLPGILVMGAAVLVILGP
ncbi:MAG: type II secretion system F family protein, partial [Planctomycetaceae bacterium]|nr:type II secretion system F family protein [Planctomycetaceae bacterium]